MPYVAILNSRQSKTPVGNDGWVQATLRAVEGAVSDGYTIVSSTGMHTWNLVTWATGHRGGQLKLVIPAPYWQNIPGFSCDPQLEKQHLINYVVGQFQLDAALTEFAFIGERENERSRKPLWSERDQAIVRQADILYPISVRPKGTLAELLAQREPNQVIPDYQIPYGKSVAIRPSYTFDRHALGELDHDWDFLTHWTRASHDPWPGERAGEFYRAVAQSRDEYPRSASAALSRILQEQKLRGSSRHIRGKYRVVGFTELRPSEAVDLMRWRPRKVRWNFEPYGVAIRRDIAETLGCRPVIYGTNQDYEQLSQEDQPFFQHIGERGGDWRPEREWRYPGDLDLKLIPQDALCVIVYSHEDKRRMSKMANFPAISLT